MRVALKNRDLWKYINGTAISPVHEDVKKREVHDKESDLAYSLIIHCIDKRLGLK